jgi:hypothetical protein
MFLFFSDDCPFFLPILFMRQQSQAIQRPSVSESSTLLVDRSLLIKVMRHKVVQWRTLKAYLHYMLSDPVVESIATRVASQHDFIPA